MVAYGAFVVAVPLYDTGGGVKLLEYEFFNKWPYCIRAHIHSNKVIDESHYHQFINLFEIVCLIKLELSSKRKH